MTPPRYHRATSLADALAVLGGPDALALGGGTDLLTMIEDGLANPAEPSIFSIWRERGTSSCVRMAPFVLAAQC